MLQRRLARVRYGSNGGHSARYASFQSSGQSSISFKGSSHLMYIIKVPAEPSTSRVAQSTISGPSTIQPTALTEACNITVSPETSPSFDRSDTNLLRVITGRSVLTILLFFPSQGRPCSGVNILRIANPYNGWAEARMHKGRTRRCCASVLSRLPGD